MHCWQCGNPLPPGRVDFCSPMCHVDYMAEVCTGEETNDHEEEENEGTSAHDVPELPYGDVDHDYEDRFAYNLERFARPGG